jgi:hypothetical protein
MIKRKPSLWLHAQSYRALVVCSLAMLMAGGATAQELTKLPFPYGRISRCALEVGARPWPSSCRYFLAQFA